MGVESRTYDIPDLVLSDTFHEWFTVTNDQIIEKLNRLEIYTLGGLSIASQGTVVGDGISASLGSGGELYIEVGSTIDKDIVFNGSITVNGSTTTINSSNFTVDDYNLILGATTEQVADETIMDISGASAGGGIIVTGASGDKEFLWQYPNSAWNSNQNIKLAENKALLDEVRIAQGMSGGNATKGLIFGFTAGTTGGLTGSDTQLRVFNTDISPGHSADVMYINDDGRVSINTGVNKITVNQSSHGMTFGNAVYLTSAGNYEKAIANNLTKAEVIGIVSRVYDTNKFEITTNGVIKGNFSDSTIGSTTIQSGQAYFLDVATSGKITTDKTTTDGYVQKTVLLGITSDEGLVVQFVGGEVDKIISTENATTSSRILISQDDHGLTYGDAVYRTIATEGPLYKRAAPITDIEGSGLSESPAEIIGICDDPRVGGNPDVASIVIAGKFGITSSAPPLVPGQTYFLKKNTDSASERNVDFVDSRIGETVVDALSLSTGDIVKPCFVSTGTHEGVITNLIGTELSSDTISDTFDDVPVGTIISAVGTLNDGNYLECNGQFITEADYPELYPLLTSLATAGGKSLPNLNGRFLVGDGSGTDVNNVSRSFTIGTTGGEYEIVLDENNIPAHQHESPYVYDHGSGGGDVDPDGTSSLFAGKLDSNPADGGQGKPGEVGGVVTGQVDAFHSASASSASEFSPGVPVGDNRMFTTSVGGNGSHSNTPPYYAVKYYIRAKGVTVLDDGTRITGGDVEHIRSLSSDAGRGFVPGSEEDGRFGNIDSNTPEGTEIQFEIPILDDVPEGTNVGLIRWVTILSAFDCDQSNVKVSYYYESHEDYKLITRADDIGDHVTTTSTLPVSPGQSKLKFKMTVEDIGSFGSSTTNADGVSITPIQYSATVDNSINRIQKSYTRKNLLINGNFDIWQRGLGTSSAYTGSSDGHFYTADRWAIRSKLGSSSPSGNYSVERKSFDLSQSTVPHNPRYYTNFKSRTVGTLGGNDYFSFEQKIKDVSTLAGKNMTVSFYAKGSLSGTCFLGYNRYYGGDTDQGTATDRDSLSLSTVSLTQDWRKYTFTVYVPNIPAGKVEGFDANGFENSYLGLALYTQLKNGKQSYNGPADINYAGTVSIAQVQVEEGGRNTLFELRDKSEELELCQSYYEKSYFPHTNPGTSTIPSGNVDGQETLRSASSSLWSTGPGTISTSTNRASNEFEYSTRKRGVATIKVYAPDGTADTIVQENESFAGSSQSVIYNNDQPPSNSFSLIDANPKVSFTGLSDRKFRGVFYATNTGSGIQKGVDFVFEWVADAELDFQKDPV